VLRASYDRGGLAGLAGGTSGPDETETLCTCRHMRIGDTWPHIAAGMSGVRNDCWRVDSVDPSTCSVDVSDCAYLNRPKETRSCASFREPRVNPNQ
jgi:hypothetical protein